MAIRKLKTIPDKMKIQIVDSIRKVMMRHDDIIFSFIYGSFVEGEVTGKYGDIDVAVYPSDIERESQSYILEARLEEEIVEELLAMNVNLIPIEVIDLKRAPYHFMVSLFKQPYLMIKENEEAFTGLIEEVGGRALANNHLRRESIREVLGID